MLLIFGTPQNYPGASAAVPAPSLHTQSSLPPQNAEREKSFFFKLTERTNQSINQTINLNLLLCRQALCLPNRILRRLSKLLSSSSSTLSPPITSHESVEELQARTIKT